MIKTALTGLLGISCPLVQAPMAGGPTTVALVAAVCEAGGLGSIAGAYLSPVRLRDEIRAVCQRTAGPFAVNLFAETEFRIDREQIAAAQERLRPWREKFGLPEPPVPEKFRERFADQLAVVLEERVPVFSFTFGIPPAPALQACRERGVRIIGTATTVAEGKVLAAAGVDAICAQTAEAGAHRGSFSEAGFTRALVGGMALIPQMADAVQVPVIASGGIMDGRGIAAALILGAAGVQLGTAFLRTPESGASAAYREALAHARDDATVITRAFSGRPARGLVNRFIEEMAPVEADLPPFPVQNALTRDIRTAAARAGDREGLSLWAGQGVPMSRDLPAAELVRQLMQETEAAFARVSNRSR